MPSVVQYTNDALMLMSAKLEVVAVGTELLGSGYWRHDNMLNDTEYDRWGIPVAFEVWSRTPHGSQNQDEPRMIHLIMHDEIVL